MDTIVGLLIMLSLPGYLVMQVAMARGYGGGWRIAALVPLLVMAPVGLVTLWGLLMGSNLWPLLLIFVSPLAALYLAGVAAARRLTH